MSFDKTVVREVTTNTHVFRCAVLLLAATVLAQPAHAALTVISVIEDPASVEHVPAMAPYLDGALMAGARVEVGYAPAGAAPIFETVFWVPDGANSGHAAGNAMGDWRISLNGDSGGNPLLLEGLTGLNGIDYLVIDLMPDYLIGAFDDVTPDPGTPGTVGGTDPWGGLTAGSAINGWDVKVSFKNAVAVGANAPQNDIYRQMRFDFTAPFVSGDYLKFVQDSDAAAIPEPASLALFGIGALLMVRRSRR